MLNARHDVLSKGSNLVQFCKLQVRTDIKKWIYDCDHQRTWQRKLTQMACTYEPISVRREFRQSTSRRSKKIPAYKVLSAGEGAGSGVREDKGRERRDERRERLLTWYLDGECCRYDDKLVTCLDLKVRT